VRGVVNYFAYKAAHRPQGGINTVTSLKARSNETSCLNRSTVSLVILTWPFRASSGVARRRLGAIALAAFEETCP
jgi:hypothetical protein